MIRNAKNKSTSASHKTMFAINCRYGSVAAGAISDRIYGKARISISPTFNCSASRATLRKLSAASVSATRNWP